MAHRRIHVMSPGIIYKYATHEQVSGQGTNGREWFSPVGGYYTSFSWLSAHWLQQDFSIILAKEIVDALNKSGVDAMIKYPNDIMIHQRKLAGIIVEQEQLGNDIAVVVGIGMNVDVDGFAEYPTTCLSFVSGITLVDVDQLIDQVIWAQID